MRPGRASFVLEKEVAVWFTPGPRDHAVKQSPEASGESKAEVRRKFDVSAMDIARFGPNA